MGRVLDMDPETQEEVNRVEEVVDDTANEQAVETEAPKAEERPAEQAHESPKEKVEISLGEELKADDHAQNNSTVRQMRERIKELDRIQKEKDKELAEFKAKYAPQQTDQLGAKPTLADAGYDEETFANRLLEWTEKKRKFDEQRVNQEREAEEANKAWQSAQERYVTAKNSLGLEDFEDYEAIVDGKFTQVQRGILLRSQQSAHLVYAIGKSPAEVERLSKIKDPVEFAWAVRDLETGKLKVGPAKPKPEGKVVSTAVASSDTEKRLEELREEARRTGNTDKLMAFKKALRAQA